jgi:N-carbamoyl-L-amino-acid hydrolase
MLSSGVFAGVITPDYAYDREDREGKRFGDELIRIGYKGDEPCGARKLGAFFELHIEQGPILEAEERTIGIVTGVQGMRWYEVTVTGMDCHAGSTPMHLRQDALVATARMIAAVQSVGLAHAPDAVATVGLIEARPNSRNVIPGEVFFSIDLRHPQDTVVAAMEADLRHALDETVAGTRITFTFDRIWDSPAVHFDEACVSSVAAASEALGYSSRRITSGAGHDAAYIARVAPTTMIFVPCEKGISHNELEKAEPGDVAAGANVLLAAVLDTDARLYGPRDR